MTSSNESPRYKLEKQIMKSTYKTHIVYGILGLLGFIFFLISGIITGFDFGWWIGIPFLDISIFLIIICFIAGVFFLYDGITTYKILKKEKKYE